MKIAFADHGSPKSGALAVTILDGKSLSPSAKALDEALGGLITRVLEQSPRFSGKFEQLMTIPGVEGIGAQRLWLLGLGKPAALTTAKLEQLGAKLQATAKSLGETEVALRVDPVDGADVAPKLFAAHVALGARLRGYSFDRYKTKKAKPADAADGETAGEDPKPEELKLTIMVKGPTAAKQAFAPLDKVADGVFLTRDLVSEPANVLYPASFAKRCKELEKLGVQVEVLDNKQLQKLGMDALLAVGQGSAHGSRVVVMHWRGEGVSEDTPPLALVGKGVTFDTGGISLKPAAGMGDMKWDMGGAGTVTGAMKALAGRKAKAHVVGIIGLVENMPDGAAQRPGDIVKSLSGQTIEVLNTDAEGRLVLADVLTYTQQRFKPAAVIDLATLTGAILVALGHEHAGLFANDDGLADQLLAASRATDEGLWRMPLGAAYAKQVESDIADLKNIAAGRWAGSIIGAVFLEKFIESGTKWAHLDVAGMVWSTKDLKLAAKGGTGYGVRLLDRLVADNYEQA